MGSAMSVWLPEARGPTSQCPSPSRVRSGLPARPRASVPQLPLLLPPTPSATPPSLALLATLDRELLLEELPTVSSDMDSSTLPLLSTLPPLSTLPLLTTPLSTPLPTPLPTLLPRCTPTRSPPTSTSTPLPTTTPAPTSRLPRLTTALLPGLDLTPLPSLTGAPSTSPTPPTTSRDTSPPSPTTSTLLPALLSTLLLWSMLPLWSMLLSTLPPCTVEPGKCPTSQCPSLTRVSTGPLPSPRPSEPTSLLSTTLPAPSTELTAGGDLPSLDTELSSVKKLHKQPC